MRPTQGTGDLDSTLILPSTGSKQDCGKVSAPLRKSDNVTQKVPSLLIILAI